MNGFDTRPACKVNTFVNYGRHSLYGLSSFFLGSSYIIFSVVLVPSRLTTAPQSRLHKNVQQAPFIYDPHLLVNKLVCLLCATYHKHIFHCLSPLPPLCWHYYITTTPSHLFSFTNIISALDVLHAWDDLRSSSSHAGFQATDYWRILSLFSQRQQKNKSAQHFVSRCLERRSQVIKHSRFWMIFWGVDGLIFNSLHTPNAQL